MANNSFVEMPELVFRHISQHLSYEDLQNLRATCKALRQIVDQRTARSLHIFVDEYPYERELFHTGELVSYANTFQVSELNILKSAKFRHQFSGLLKLTIDYRLTWPWPDYKSVDLDDLNCFQELVHLELISLSMKTGKLSLKNLKIALFLHTIHVTRTLGENMGPVHFELDCPQLEVLSLGSVTQPSLTNETSLSVRHLYIQHGGLRTINQTYLFDLCTKLQRLSSICFDGHNSADDLHRFVVALNSGISLPSLKVIQSEEANIFPEHMLESLPELKDAQETKHIDIQINRKAMNKNELVELLNVLKRVLPLLPIQTFFASSNGFHIDSPDVDLLRQFNENTILHCLLPSVGELKIRSDEEALLVEPLIGKLRNIHSLALSNGVHLDEELIERILKTSRKLCYLRIGCSDLKQKQLDRLPNYLLNLRELALEDDFGLSNFNLEFVTKFENLYWLRLNFPIENETIRFLFKNGKYPPCFTLDFSQEGVQIRRKKNAYAPYTIHIYHSEIFNRTSEFKFANLDNVIKQLPLGDCVDDFVERLRLSPDCIVDMSDQSQFRRSVLEHIFEQCKLMGDELDLEEDEQFQLNDNRRPANRPEPFRIEHGIVVCLSTLMFGYALGKVRGWF